MFTIYKSLIYNDKYHHPSHIYTDFEGTGGAPLDIVDRYIHPHSHMKRNLDFYLSYNLFFYQIHMANEKNNLNPLSVSIFNSKLLN